jgi:hypothetical protein
MPDTTTTVPLNSAEWRLIQGLRGLPASELRDRIHQVLDELLFYVRNPRCQGVGPEGFPCGDPRSTCEECHRIWDLLDGVAKRVEAQEEEHRRLEALRTGQGK